MRSGRRTRELEDNVSSEGGENDMEYVDDFFLSSGDKYPSLMELPFAIQEIQWERTHAERVFIRGKTGNGLDDVMSEIDLWRLELPLEGKPRFLVHKVSGPWMQLRKPHDIYLETMKVVLVAAYFLTFAKQCPNASKGAVWRYVRKECSSFKAKANDRDLAQAFLLLQSIVKTDVKLETSPMIQKFFPTLFKKLGSQVDTGAEVNEKDVRVTIMKRENSSPVHEPNLSERGNSKKIFSGVEDSGDHVKGESSTQSRQRMRSLDSFAVELDLPLSKRLNVASTKKKPGRLVRTRKKGKQKPQPSGKREGDEEWVDEPDVCSICDDGVEGGEKLLCCDGQCMRSFHPTIDSGWKNQCASLGLTRAAVSDESYICPNCAHKQHQCFSCGKLGNSCNSEYLQEVFVCGARACRRFYHPNCVAKLLVPEPAHHALASRIQLGLEIFYCPLHKCASCKLEEDKTDPEQRLIKCRRCPVAWHMKCLPRNRDHLSLDVMNIVRRCEAVFSGSSGWGALWECREHLWPVDCGNFVMYCGTSMGSCDVEFHLRQCREPSTLPLVATSLPGDFEFLKHKVDPNLLTPKRDHITFPKPILSGEAAPSSNGSVLSSVIGCWSSCNVPLPGNFGEGPDDVRAYERVCEIITESQEAVTLEKIRRTVKPAPPCQDQACSQPRE